MFGCTRNPPHYHYCYSFLVTLPWWKMLPYFGENVTLVENVTLPWGEHYPSVVKNVIYLGENVTLPWYIICLPYLGENVTLPWWKCYPTLVKNVTLPYWKFTLEESVTLPWSKMLTTLEKMLPYLGEKCYPTLVKNVTYIGENVTLPWFKKKTGDPISVEKVTLPWWKRLPYLGEKVTLPWWKCSSWPWGNPGGCWGPACCAHCCRRQTPHPCLWWRWCRPHRIAHHGTPLAPRSPPEPADSCCRTHGGSAQSWHKHQGWRDSNPPTHSLISSQCKQQGQRGSNPPTHSQQFRVKTPGLQGFNPPPPPLTHQFRVLTPGLVGFDPTHSQSPLQSANTRARGVWTHSLTLISSKCKHKCWRGSNPLIWSLISSECKHQDWWWGLNPITWSLINSECKHQGWRGSNPPTHLSVQNANTRAVGVQTHPLEHSSVQSANTKAVGVQTHPLEHSSVQSANTTADGVQPHSLIHAHARARGVRTHSLDHSWGSSFYLFIVQLVLLQCKDISVIC